MARSTWKGSISFGMVAIPVNLFTATQSKNISFNLLHNKCKTRVHNKRWCAEDDCEVTADEMVRGYEYARDHYVVLTDEDFESLPVPSKHTIELTAFVNADEVDSVYYSKSYYLEPTEAGKKPYALLLRALEQKSLIGLAKITLREKEHLCALRPSEGTLVLETLFYPDEITLVADVIPETTKVSDKELQMAFTLIDILTEEFQPDKYKDEYRHALMQRIESKIEGKEIEVAPEPRHEQGKVIDLMAALRASVEAVKKSGASAKEEEPKPKAHHQVKEAEPEEPHKARREKAPRSKAG
jgi:DNA end-binding protein Ku